MDVGGSVLEEGAAEADLSERWIYAAQTSVREGTSVHVEATAMDLTGGMGTASAEIAVKHGVSFADGPELGMRQAVEPVIRLCLTGSTA